MKAWFTQPEWVISGGMTSDGSCMLIASRSLTGARLDVRQNFTPPASFWDLFHGAVGPPVGRPKCFLTVEMPNYVIIYASSYEEALRDLFTRWSPTSAPQMALEPSDRKAIGE